MLSHNLFDDFWKPRAPAAESSNHTGSNPTPKLMFYDWRTMYGSLRDNIVADTLYVTFVNLHSISFALNEFIYPLLIWTSKMSKKMKNWIQFKTFIWSKVKLFFFTIFEWRNHSSIFSLFSFIPEKGGGGSEMLRARICDVKILRNILILTKIVLWLQRIYRKLSKTVLY